MTPTRRPRRRPHPRLSQAVAGDRPYVAVLFVLLALLAAMLVGPLQSFTSASERVENLSAERAELAEQVAELERRKARLTDSAEIELLAREQLGLVRPGEIPYVVADDGGDDDRIRPDGREPEPVEDLAWHERVGRHLRRLLRR